MDAPTQELPPPPPPYQPPARGRLERKRQGNILFGVARGLADYLAIDVVLVRVVLVILAIAGVGVVLYLAGALLMPAEGEATSIGDRLLERLHGAPPWLIVVLLVGAGLLLIGRFLQGGLVFWGLVLVAVGVWLYVRDQRGIGTRPTPVPPATWTPRAAWTPPTEGAPSTPAWTGPAATVPTVPIAPPRPPRVRSLLGRYTVAATLLILGGAAILDTTKAVHVPARAYPDLALLVIGAGLLVGTFLGRSRLLILAGLLVLPFALVGSVVRVPVARGAGARLYAPTTVSSVRGEYHLGAGQLKIDLTGLAWGTSPLTVRATVAAGRLEVDVPDTVTVHLHAHAGAGVVQTSDDGVRSEFTQEGHGGVGTTVDRTFAGSANGPVLNLNLDTSLGVVQVDRFNQGSLPEPVTIPATPTAPVAPAGP